MIELLLRLVASLAVVVGLLLVLARLGSRRFAGSPDSLVRVLHRQPLSRTSSLAVVDVAGRVLVLGATEHQISLVAELDAVDLENAQAQTEVPFPREAADPVPMQTAGPAGSRDAAQLAALASRSAGHALRPGALSGSVLSPATWQAARTAVTGRNPAGRRRAGGSRRAS